MDGILLAALIMMWLGSTVALVIFLGMWFLNDGEAFHPHSVDAEQRHSTFVVVNSKTVCKTDCAVKSISAFVAPRGSSSSKHFTTIATTITIAGILGSTRWYLVGDASPLEALLSSLGFGALLLVASFELDVDAERFLEDKLMITGWLIERLALERALPFPLKGTSPQFREFIRSSPEIYHLYEEDRYLRTRLNNKKMHKFSYELVWESAHVAGAVLYVILIPVAIILNDYAEEKVGWITGLSFFVFCTTGFFSGSYVDPLFRPFKGVLLTWNPFLREPHFMLKLKRSVEAYALESDSRVKGLHSTSPSHPHLSHSYSNSPNTSGTLRQRTASATSVNSVASGKGDGIGTNGNKNGNENGNRNIYGNVIGNGMMEMGNGGGSSSSRRKKNKRRKNKGTVGAVLDGGVDGEYREGISIELEEDNGIDAFMVESPTLLTSLKSGSIHKSDSMTSTASRTDLGSVDGRRPRVVFNAIDRGEAAAADLALDTWGLQYARAEPRAYLRIVGYCMVLSELVALLTPLVAMGIQWITALCDGPPVYAILELGAELLHCAYTGGLHCDFHSEQFQHCILKQHT